MAVVKMIPGKHRCGKKLVFRFEDGGDGNFWVMYGVCKRCLDIAVTEIFPEVPMDGRDFMIDYEESCGEDVYY